MAGYLVLHRHGGLSRVEGLAWCHQRHGSVQGGEARAAPPCHGPAMGGAHLVESWDATAVATLPALGRPSQPASHAPSRHHGPEWEGREKLRERERGPRLTGFKGSMAAASSPAPGHAPPAAAICRERREERERQSRQQLCISSKYQCLLVLLTPG